jgi:glycosyltransferase involved in cell wall biosynthesis
VAEHLDLGLLRACGVPVVVTFQGSDARQTTYFERHLHPGERTDLEAYVGADRDRHKRRRILSFARRAAHMFFLNPDLAAALPQDKATFLPYAVSIPELPVRVPERRKRIIIAHAPSNRAVKGTRRVIEAVGALGDRAELDLVENVSRQEALARLSRADLVIDQVVIGWYGATAVEAMAMGRPVVATIDNEELACVPPELLAQLPVIRTPRTGLADTLRSLLRDRTALEARGSSGPGFVRAWHHPLRVAEKTRTVYLRLLGNR